MNRFAPEWKNFCVYTGKHLPDVDLNDEHVIPKSLGGFRSTVIRASRELNSQFATTIDARIANDAMVQFGRRDANARGHSKKKAQLRYGAGQRLRKRDLLGEKARIATI